MTKKARWAPGGSLAYQGGGQVTAWCYVCASPHAYGAPCNERRVARRTTMLCSLCGAPFVGDRRMYCSPDCQHRAKLDRQAERRRGKPRKRYDGRAEAVA